MLEASTGYTKFPNNPSVPQRIFDYGIKPHFFYLVRNPFDRIRSHYLFRKNFLQKELGLKSISIVNEELLDISKYYMQISKYLELFPKENITIIDFDWLKHTPQKVLDLMTTQLGIEHFTPDNFDIHNKTSSYQPNEREAGWLRKIFLKKNEIGKFSEDEYNLIHSYLKDDMKRFAESFAVDVKKWGF